MDSETPNVPWRPLRIAVTGGRGVPSNYSGVEPICENLFGYFAQKGHKVTIYCRPTVLAEKRGMHKGMRLVRTAAPGGKNGETLSHSFTSILHAVTRGDVFEGNQRFDLLSVHTIAPNLFLPIASMVRMPIISHVHGLDHQREKWKGMGARMIRAAERTMVRCATEVVTVNPAIVDYYKTEFNIIARLLPNGIHPVSDDFTPDPNVLKQWGLEPGKYIVSVGRLVPEKRIGDSITAFARLDTDWKLVFVGEGKHSPEYVEEIKALAAKNPKNRVIFTGIQSGDALQTLFRSAGLYVSASELEGLPSSVLECMDRAVPAVLSDIPPHSALYEAVEGYDLGFKTGDVDELTAKLQYAMTNPDHVRKIAASARTMVRANYTWPVLAERTERLYLAVDAAKRAKK